MDTHQASIDIDLFRRTAQLFAAKRMVLPQDAVATVASEIVRRLAEAKLRRPDVKAPEIAQDRIEAFCDLLIQPDPAAALGFIADRRAEGLTRQGVYLGYVSGAARCLGERWDRDEVSFMAVTSGTGHLYALMRAMRAEGPDQTRFDSRRDALFATVPGEDHGIGITMAADLFRQAGWQIDLETGTDHDRLLARVEATAPQVIGLSLSTENRLDALVRLVVAIRLVLPGALIGVAPGFSVDADRLRALVDIDLVFTDAPSAFRELERLRG
jgi:methanogenic corrinoid protein MtbC1